MTGLNLADDDAGVPQRGQVWAGGAAGESESVPKDGAKEWAGAQLVDDRCAHCVPQEGQCCVCVIPL